MKKIILTILAVLPYQITGVAVYVHNLYIFRNADLGRSCIAARNFLEKGTWPFLQMDREEVTEYLSEIRRDIAESNRLEITA